jgi:plasmid stability protein
VSDRRLRNLERRFRNSGSVEDEARLLLERARAGELEPARLALAAFLGHAGARLACGQLSAVEPEDLTLLLTADGLPRLHQALDSFGREASLRGLLALAELARDQLAEWPHVTDLPLGVLATAEAWLLDPVPARRDALAAGAEAFEEAFRDLSRPGVHMRGAHHLLFSVVRDLERVAHADIDVAVVLRDAARRGAEALTPVEVRDALCTRLLPWALAPCPVGS